MEMKLLSRAIKVHFSLSIQSDDESELPANATLSDWFESAINKAFDTRQKERERERMLRNSRDIFTNQFMN